jgi:hypothetical protein
MNQTKKRLAIIKLAISMTDTETIQLQVLKLGLLKTDSKMAEILSMLNAHNYAQAQRLISSYIETPSETTIIQRTSQKEAHKAIEKVPTPLLEEAMLNVKEVVAQEKDTLTLKEKIQQAKDQALIDQFELFAETETEEEEVIEEINYDDFLNLAPKPKKMSETLVNYDALLNVEAEDVLPDNISLDISEVIEKPSHVEELAVSTPIQKEEQAREEKNEDIIPQKEDTPTKPYKSISYIDQKFKNMLNQYPIVTKSDKTFSSVDTWLIQISNDGYTENEVEQAIKKVESLSQSQPEEAAKLLLVTAATESKYAQFRLARALYKGQILQKNLPEAFTLINHLAMHDDYPEAICDLAQFYENGIGITKDKKKSEELYKEAMDLGIHRAIDHYERIHKENKGLLSIFKR